jgi:hypothetical protein
MVPGPFYYKAPTLLSQEERCHKKYIGVPAEAYMAKDPHGDDQRYREVNGQEPLGRKTFDMCSPVAEWNVQDKYDNAY